MFSEIGITLADGSVWLAIGQALLFAAGCLVFGVWLTRTVGLLAGDAPAGETLAVGLAAGLLVLAAWWAAVASAGRSSFTPVAIGFAIAVALAVVRRMRRAAVAEAASAPVQVSSEIAAPEAVALPRPSRRRLVVALVGGAVFIAAVALLYGSTMVQSPRDGVQPLEVMDEAYYSILGTDLARTGTESMFMTSGFGAIDGMAVQTWYHWGELWLEAAVITVVGTPPLDARHFVVLPVLLLAAAGLTGTLVRRVTRSASGGAYMLGFLACLFLAPMPLIPGPHFASWAVGLVFGITLYGLAAVALLFVLYCLVVVGRRGASWALAAFVGSSAAMLLPAHIVIAVLALGGIGTVWALRTGQSFMRVRRLPAMAPIWHRTCVVAGVAIVATVAWGLATGHGLSSGLSSGISPFNETWRDSLAITALGAGAFTAIPIAWFLARRRAPVEADLYLGTASLIVAGAIVWGTRLGDYNTFHVFFAGIAVFATPVAAIAVWSIWLRLRDSGHARVGVVVLVLVGTQLELGVATSFVRLQAFGPHEYPPVPIAILDEIRNLPPTAKLAYACQPSEELAFWDPRLMGIDAHAGRRVVPMCFQNDFFGPLIGAAPSIDVANPLFQLAPQRALYPDSRAQPSPELVTAFLKQNGIDYIYADAKHPNTLVPSAIPIAANADVEILRVP